MSRQPHGVATSFTTTLDHDGPKPWGKEVPKSFEPKSSNGHLASFCINCNQRIECHGSYWALGVGTLRVCDPANIAKADATKASDANFRGQLKAQEADNCRPTKTVANMERYDPTYYGAGTDMSRVTYGGADGGYYNESSSARHQVTRVMQPIMTPYGTNDNNYDCDQADPRRGRRPVDDNINNGSNFYGAGAVATPEPPANRSARYR